MRDLLLLPVRRVMRMLRHDRSARQRGENDAPADLGVSRSRPGGGEADPEAADTHSTTGTTPHDDFVGRAGGDDPGDLREGAERRSEADPEHGRGEA